MEQIRDFFWSRFSTFWLGNLKKVPILFESNCTEIWSVKVLDLSHLLPIWPKCRPKSDIPEIHPLHVFILLVFDDAAYHNLIKFNVQNNAFCTLVVYLIFINSLEINTVKNFYEHLHRVHRMNRVHKLKRYYNSLATVDSYLKKNDFWHF